MPLSPSPHPKLAPPRRSHGVVAFKSRRRNLDWGLEKFKFTSEMWNPLSSTLLEIRGTPKVLHSVLTPTLPVTLLQLVTWKRDWGQAKKIRFLHDFPCFRVGLSVGIVRDGNPSMAVAIQLTPGWKVSLAHEKDFPLFVFLVTFLS